MLNIIKSISEWTEHERYELEYIGYILNINSVEYYMKDHIIIDKQCGNYYICMHNDNKILETNKYKTFETVLNIVK